GAERGVGGGRGERREEGGGKAAQNAEEGVLDLLLPPTRSLAADDRGIGPAGEDPAPHDAQTQTRERFREQLRAGRLDHRVVEIDVREKSFPSFEIVSGSSVEEVDINLNALLPSPFH